MRWLLLVSLFITSPLYAEQDKTEISEGQLLHDKACLSCHDSMTNGKPEQIYTREDRTESSVENFAGLQNRVRACANNTGVQWFDDEVAKVVDYLNQSYYGFNSEQENQEITK